MASKIPFFLDPFGIFEAVKNELNPFQNLLKAPEDNKDNFRLDVDMRFLNELIRREVLDESENLLNLDAFAREGKIIVRGEYHTGNYRLARLFKVYEVLFNVDLVPVWVKSNQVRFRISSSLLRNKKKRKFDFVKWIAEILPYHKRIIIQELADLYPNQLSLTKLKYEIKLNLNYYLEKANLSPDAVKVHKVIVETDRLVFYVRSTIVLRSLVDFFGSQVLSVTDLPKEFSSKALR
ncbi:MAG: hypothetical protein SFU98_16985 [Leptospiraceae bacterium]|nr:hypothetical protein [Leptospiraceae bacterium]